MSDFAEFPKVLLKGERYGALTPEAALLYTLMLDRIKLSDANGWHDDNGNVYEYFGIANIQKHLKCSRSTAVARKKELTDAGLIRSVKQKRPLPDRIYVLPFATDSTKTEPTMSENQTNDGSEISLSKVGISDPNNTEYINTEMNNIYLSSDGYDRNHMRMMIRENIEYEVLSERGYDMGFVNDLINLMLDCICSQSGQIRLGDRIVGADAVRSRFLQINMQDIQYVIDSIGRNTTEVRNTRSYLLATLYNAPLTRRTHYMLKAQHDMPQLCQT